MDESIRIDIVDYPDPIARSRLLGCNAPNLIALLPRNFLDAQLAIDLYHEFMAPTVRVLWRRAGIAETPLETQGAKFPTVEERGVPDWIVPTIFIGSAMLGQGEVAISLAINVISNYLYDLSIGQVHRGVQLDVVVEKRPGCEYKKIKYRGPVEGMSRISKIIAEVGSDGSETS